MFNSKKETMGQSLPFKSNEGKHIKFDNRVSKTRMKAKKCRRHSLKVYFHRHVYFLSQVFNLMLRNDSKYTDKHACILSSVSKIGNRFYIKRKVSFIEHFFFLKVVNSTQI